MRNIVIHFDIAVISSLIMGQYYPGLALWMYELALHQEHSIDIDKEDLRQFISLFSRMMSISLPIPIENLRTIMLVVYGGTQISSNHFRL